MTDIKRGDIFYADLRPVVGSEQGGIRPVIILQNDTGNKYSPTTIVASLTSNVNKKANVPTHIVLYRDHANGLRADSVVLCEQIRTIDKKRIKEKIGRINDSDLDVTMDKIKTACKLSLGFW